MRRFFPLFLVFYLCGLFFNASLIVIVLLNWPMELLPFWFRLMFAAAPLFFFAAGYAIRKDRPGVRWRQHLPSALLLCGVLLLLSAVLAVKAPHSMACWFLFPVAGDLVAAFGRLLVWRPLYSVLGAVGTPLLFELGILCYPLVHTEEEKKP